MVEKYTHTRWVRDTVDLEAYLAGWLRPEIKCRLGMWARAFARSWCRLEGNIGIHSMCTTMGREFCSN